MNKITKEKMYNLLNEKIKVEEDEKELLINLVNELYDTNKKIVIPLDELETLVFREKYGILNNGIPKSKELICKEYNIGYQKIFFMLEKIFVKFIFRIKKIDKISKIEKINSLNTNNSEILNTPVSSFPINVTIKNILMKEYIITLKDLMEYSTNELKDFLGPKRIEELINYIHSLNYKFINELSDEEKKIIIENNDKEIISNSSPYLITGLDKYQYNVLKRNNIKDVKSLAQNLFIFPTKDRLEMMYFISKNNLSYLGREEESKKI